MAKKPSDKRNLECERKERKRLASKVYYVKNRERIRASQADYYANNPEILKAKVKAAGKSPVARTRILLRAAQGRAQEKGLDFSLTREDIIEKLEKGVCEVTGIEFDFDAYSPFGPSLDRIDPNLGYTKENTAVVVKSYNYAKGCGTHDDVVKLAKALLYGPSE